MTTLGLLFMVTAVGGVTLFFAWCLVRVLRAGPKRVERLHAPLEIEAEEFDSNRHQKAEQKGS